MSKKRPQRTSGQVEHDRSSLQAAGYEIREMSPWHWHVQKPGHWLIVNVWPTAGKYMQNRGSAAQRYVDVVKAVNGLYKHYEGGEKDEQMKAKKQVDEMRAGGLDYFINKKHE